MNINRLSLIKQEFAELMAKPTHTERDLFIGVEIKQRQIEALRDLERDIRDNGYQEEPLIIEVEGKKIEFDDVDSLSGFLSSIMYRS